MHDGNHHAGHRETRARGVVTITAAIIMHEDSIHAPDYHALTVTRDVVPVFPWHGQRP